MTKITIAKGDGIGPEIMDATLSIILAAGAKIEIEEIEVGENVYLSGNTSGIADSSWESIRKNKVFLKAPITTPQGGGYKSLNVTTRKFLGLYSNVRPCYSLHPFVQTKHPVMDVVIIMGCAAVWSVNLLNVRDVGAKSHYGSVEFTD